MIVPRIRYFSDLQARKMITKLTEKLDKDRIGDFIRSMAAHIRTITILERDIYVMKLSGSLTFEQIYKLIREIIDTEEFCTIIDCD